MTLHPPLDCGFNEDAIDQTMRILHCLLFILALIMNGVAVWVCWHLHSTSNFIVYLKNLVAADLLMTLAIPLKAANDMPSAPLALKAFCCRYSDVVFYFCMYMSIILLALISLDRFFKIVKPRGMVLGQKLVFSKVMSAFFWVALSASELIPTVVLTNQDPANNTFDFCMKMKSQTGQDFHHGVILFNNSIFWLSCVLTCFCYVCITRKVIQSYRNSGSNNDNRMYRTNVRVFSVLVVFLVCFVPYHAIRIPYTELQVTSTVSCNKSALRITKKITLWISTVNVSLDPLIYFFLCKSFRTTLFKTLRLQSGTSWVTRKAPDLTSDRAASDDLSLNML